MKKNFWIFTILLIVVEQVIKLIINANYLDSRTPIIGEYVMFIPSFNRDYSWLNSLFDLGVSKVVHIVFTALILIFIIAIYIYMLQTNAFKIIKYGMSFMLAGAFCSLVDKVFWDGSLDYIYLNGMFTFDLKDVYLNVAIGLWILAMIVHKDIVMSYDENEVFVDFKKYYLNMIKREKSE